MFAQVMCTIFIRISGTMVQKGLLTNRGMKMAVTERIFGELSTGQDVRAFRLVNHSGAYAEVMDFGAILLKLCVPDRGGKLTDVVLGYDDVKQYEENGCFFGAVVGRNCNRIAGANFEIFGKKVQLTPNENENNLHSGPDGFEKKMWQVTDVSQEKNSVIFSRISPDGENGYPGEFHVSVKYEFTEENELRISYSGVSSQDTIANMTNHSYFNLAGEGSGSILDQTLTIHSQYYTPVADAKSIPTGVYAPVEGTPMDFTHAKEIGRDIEADFEQLKLVGGFDHNYVTNSYAKGSRRPIAAAYAKKSGICMTVVSDCPCVQLYTGNFIVSEDGKNGHTYHKRDGFCLETQVEPDAVHVEAFHSPILEQGQTYTSFTSYAFCVR